MAVTKSIKTKKPTDITDVTATSGGYSLINPDEVTESGVVYDTSPIPTINDTADSTGTAPYNSPITGLIADTVYYVRAYMVDASVTTYGEQWSFKTNILPSDDNSCTEYTVDIESNQTYVIPVGSELVSVSDDTNLRSDCINKFIVE